MWAEKPERPGLSQGLEPFELGPNRTTSSGLAKVPSTYVRWKKEKEEHCVTHSV